MKRLRFLLFPIAGVYSLITLLRNTLFDFNILRSKQYAVPVICIGNLSTGGTGKSPMTEYLIRLLASTYRVATLSRGYGRTSSGYLDVSTTDKALVVGDEPLQFARKFKEARVAVCEDRQTGIETLLAKAEPPEVIILDDAFQHRKVLAGFNILLTSYDDLYINDYILPVGNLRESAKGASRAHIIVVTKCPNTLTQQAQAAIRSSLKLNLMQHLYFSTIVYDEQIYSEREVATLNSLKVKKVTVVTGIANPAPLLTFLKSKGLSFEHKSYKDHHNYSSVDIRELEKLDTILTTEKDFVRLQSSLELKNLFYIPIKTEFLMSKLGFDTEITNFVNSFSRIPSSSRGA